MTRVFDENGVVTASTLVEAGPCFITQLRSVETDGYTAVQLGFGQKPRPSKPQRGLMRKAGLPDRNGLEAASCGCYRLISKEFDRLLT